MSKGFAVTRTKNKPDLFFFVEDSNGELIPIKQTLTEVGRGQARLFISAPDNVKIRRGETLEKDLPQVIYNNL